MTTNIPKYRQIENELKTINHNLVLNGDLSVDGNITKTQYNPGETIEYLSSPCDGSTVSGISGDYTWPTVSAVQLLTTTFEDMTGSSISYTPPTGTTKVIYRLTYLASRFIDAHGIISNMFYIDDTEVLYARYTVGSDYLAQRVVFEWPINIGGDADTNVGRVETWTTAKTLKLQAREYGASNEAKLHETYYWENAASSQFSMPVLTIIAIA
jgi:hypothetical protein